MDEPETLDLEDLLDEGQTLSDVQEPAEDNSNIEKLIEKTSQQMGENSDDLVLKYSQSIATPSKSLEKEKEDFGDDIIMQQLRSVEAAKEEKKTAEEDKKPKKKKFSAKNYTLPENIRTPTYFVDYMERDFHKNEIYKREARHFQIANYKRKMMSANDKDKYKSIKFPTIENLKGRMFREADRKKITCFTVKDELVFIGNDKNEVKYFTMDKQFEIMSFTSKEIPATFVENNTETNNEVTCLEVSKDNLLLLSGHKNGFIAIWEIKSGKSKRIIKPEDSPDFKLKTILSIKCLALPKKKAFAFIASDAGGSVLKMTCSESMFGFFKSSALSVECESLIQHKKPLPVVEVMEPSKEERAYKFYETKPEIVAFGCVDFVLIYQVEPSIVKFYEFARPKYMSGLNLVPDISFGVGYVPRRDDSVSFEHDVNQRMNILAAENGLDCKSANRLIAISWDTFVNVFCLRIDPFDGPQKVSVVGHVNFKERIRRMEFICDSTLYVLDDKNNLMFLNTGLMEPADLELDEASNKPCYSEEKSLRPLLQTPLKIKKDILFQELVDVKTFCNTVKKQDKSLYVMFRDDFVFISFNTWRQTLNELKDTSDWMRLFLFGEEIFKGKFVPLVGLPVDVDERKKEVAALLREFIFQYNKIAFESKQRGDEYLNKLKNCITLSIEFCLIINSADFLLENLKPFFDGKDLSEFFFESLEPFILSGKVYDCGLNARAVQALANLYEKNGSFHLLERIIISLRHKEIATEQVERLIKDHNLYTALIYFYTNGGDKNFMLPINKMYRAFVQSKSKKLAYKLKEKNNYDEENKKENYFDYQSVINSMELEDLDASYHYLGSKILWFIEVCLAGKLFPHNDEIPDKMHSDLVKKIFLFLLNDAVLNSFVNFDSFTLFEVFSNCFTEHFDVIKEIEYDNILFMGVNFDTENNDLNNVQKFLKIIVDAVAKKDNLYVKDDLSFFVCNVATQIKDVQKDYVISALKHLLKFRQNNYDENNYDHALKVDCDFYNLHYNRYRNPQLERNLTRTLHKCVENYVRTLKESDLFALVSAAQDSSLCEVSIYLNTLLRNYHSCLDIYLRKTAHPQLRKGVYPFVKGTLKELSENKNQEMQIKLREFKLQILERATELASISVYDLYSLVETWFEANHGLVLGKIRKSAALSSADVSELKLQYIENVREKYREVEISLAGKEEEDYDKLLEIYFILLCDLGRFEEIIPSIQNRKYPAEILLRLCDQYRLLEVAIYIHKLNGNLDEAFALVDLKLTESKKQLLETINDPQKFIISKENYEKFLAESVSICEMGKDLLSPQECEKKWFDTLGQYYTIKNEVSTYENINDTQKKELEDIHYNAISNIVNKMVPYIGPQKIVERICEHQRNKVVDYRFKKLLAGIFTEYNCNRNIYSSIRNLVDDVLQKSKTELTKELTKGYAFTTDKCSVCYRDFRERDGSIHVFKCGHKMHYLCSVLVNERCSCAVCYAESKVANDTHYEDIRVEKPRPRSVIKRSEGKSEKKVLSKEERRIVERNFGKLTLVNKRYFDNCIAMEVE